MAVQALYQWHMSSAPLNDIEAQFFAVNNMERVDEPYFKHLLHGVVENRQALDARLIPLLDRPLEQLNPVELTVLRICAFELCHCLELPYRIILDESVALTKTFGSQDGHRYVNGVLHQLALQVRSIEMNDTTAPDE